jgi:hypothetical protein
MGKFSIFFEDLRKRKAPTDVTSTNAPQEKTGVKKKDHIQRQESLSVCLLVEDIVTLSEAFQFDM